MTRDTVKSRGERSDGKSDAHHKTRMETPLDSPAINGTTGHSKTLGELADTRGAGDNKDPSRHLSPSHIHQLLEESGISPEVSRERVYGTVTRRSELLRGFKDYQRGRGLYIPTYSPDGTTTSAQLKRDTPRKNKKGQPLKYETPGGSKIILDVHPRMLEEVRAGAEDLWITEGIKKADSLTSRGLPTIGLIGVWNWQRGGELLPCWDHVRLDGRRVYVVFDSDVMAKEGVQLALERLVAALEARGADVMVCYLPEVSHA